MDGKIHDELEKLMRSRLLDNSPADNQWNVPPDDVFLGAMEALPEEEKPKRRFLFIIPILFGLGIIATYIFSTNSKIDKLHTEISDLKSQKDIASAQTTEVLNNQNESIQKATAKKENTDTQTEKIASTNNAAKKNRKLGKTKSNQKANKNQQLLNASTTKKQASLEKPQVAQTSSDAELVRDRQTPKLIVQDASSESIADQSSNNASNSAVNTSEAQVRKSSLLSAVEEQVKQINSLDSRPLELLAYDANVVLDQAPQLVIQESEAQTVTKAKTLQFLVFGGANTSSLMMKNTGNTSFSLTEYDDQYKGYQFGIGLEYPLSNRLNLNSNLSYARYTNHSYYQDQFIYDEANERTNSDGTVDYVDDVSIVSPMHEMQESASFRVDNHDVAQNDVMDKKIGIDEKFNAIGLSLGLDYTAIRLNKFHVNIGAGVRGQYITHMSESMDMKIYHQGKTMMDEKKESVILEDVNRTFASLYGQIGLGYDLSPKFSINVISGYDHALNSIRQANTNSDPSTYLRSLTLSAGAKYRF